MKRFYLPPDRCRDSTLILADREAHHAVRVLRLRQGERVVVLDGAGREFLCEARACSRAKVELAVRQTNFIPAPRYQITLLQAIPKGKAFENIIQKATELGVFRVRPLLSERVATELDGATAQRRTAKWRVTAIEAIKQSGAGWLPRIDAPVALRAFLARGEKFDLTLIASLQPDGRPPRQWVNGFIEERKRLPESVGVWVGPEGDFTPAEMSAIRSAGALPITLGPRVLRSETAAMYCLAVLNYEFESRGV